jgi:prepilin-type N-terminal cleavage/methylation domain-containing protein
MDRESLQPKAQRPSMVRRPWPVARADAQRAHACLTDQPASQRSGAAGRSLITDHRSLSLRGRASAPRPAVALREGGFTLLELLIVVGIIGLLLVLIAPAFTTMKSGTDVTSAAYTIKGVLDTARTYASGNQGNSLRPLGARWTFYKGTCSQKSGVLPHANFAFSPYMRTFKT